MDIEKLIEKANHLGMELKRDGGELEYSIGKKFLEYATALSTLQAENSQLRADLEYDREHANAYHEECGQWEAENERLRAELEQVKAEKAKAIENLSDNLRIAYQSRDAAVEDVAAIIGDVEEIRRGYGVDNADADSAFANLCGNYCANNGHCCYEESENYRCKHFEWRGMAKED